MRVLYKSFRRWKNLKEKLCQELKSIRLGYREKKKINEEVSL